MILVSINNSISVTIRASTHVGLCHTLCDGHVLVYALDVTVKVVEDVASAELVRAREEAVRLWWTVGQHVVDSVYVCYCVCECARVCVCLCVCVCVCVCTLAARVKS